MNITRSNRVADHVRSISPLNCIKLSVLLALFVAAMLWLASPLLHAQTAAQPPVAAPVWFNVSLESTSTTLTIPAGTTYQLGTASCAATGGPAWSAPVMVTAATTFNPLDWSNGVFPFADPCDGTVKTLQVAETAAQQTLTLNGAVFNVPALQPPPVTVTLSAIQVTSQTSPDWIGIYDLPTSGAYTGWEGSQLALTIGGVSYVCSYISAAAGTYTLSCTPQ